MKRQRWGSHSIFKLGLLTTVAFGAFSLSTAFSSRAALAQERLPGVIDRPPMEVPAEVMEPVEMKPEKVPEMEKPEGQIELAAELKEVRLSGDVVLGEKALHRVVAPYLNRPLTRDDIVRLKFDLAKRYYDKGYVLVKITTPPQDLSDGVLDVVVYAGRVGDVVVNSTDIRPSVPAAMMKKVKKGEIFNERTVESAVKDVDDITNIKARLNLRPGTEVGTTDLVLTAEAAREDVQEFTVDNYGSDLTGNVVFTLDLQKSNLLKMGETMELLLRKSDKDLNTIYASYRTPVLLRNVRLDVNYLNSNNGIGDRLASLQATGRSERFGVALYGDVINMLQRKVSWRAGLDVRRHESFLTGIIESRDDITQAYGEVSYLVRKPGYVLYTSVRVTKGIDFLGSDSMGEGDASRAAGDPQAWRVKPTLYANIRMTENNFLQAYVLGQYASKTLLASDLFAIGGYGSVRGFQPAQETGDNGLQASVEYSYRFVGTEIWDVKAGPFVDAGTVYNRVAGASVDTQLYSAGLGAEAVARYFGFGASKFRFDWAHTLGDYLDPTTASNNNTFYVRFTQNF